jgi:hypothetical protein
VPADRIIVLLRGINWADGPGAVCLSVSSPQFPVVEASPPSESRTAVSVGPACPGPAVRGLARRLPVGKNTWGDPDTAVQDGRGLMWRNHIKRRRRAKQWAFCLGGQSGWNHRCTRTGLGRGRRLPASMLEDNTGPVPTNVCCSGCSIVEGSTFESLVAEGVRRRAGLNGGELLQ